MRVDQTSYPDAISAYPDASKRLSSLNFSGIAVRFVRIGPDNSLIPYLARPPAPDRGGIGKRGRIRTTRTGLKETQRKS